jgi:hypothetical protein
MYVTQVSDRTLFAQQLKEVRSPVSVVRSPTVVPVERGGAIVMHPAVVIQYSLHFRDPSTGDTSWVFRETRLANERGDVDLTGTLFEELEQQTPRRYVLVHRSGSI